MPRSRHMVEPINAATSAQRIPRGCSSAEVNESHRSRPSMQPFVIGWLQHAFCVCTAHLVTMRLSLPRVGPGVAWKPPCRGAPRRLQRAAAFQLLDRRSTGGGRCGERDGLSPPSNVVASHSGWTGCTRPAGGVDTLARTPSDARAWPSRSGDPAPLIAGCGFRLRPLVGDLQQSRRGRP